MVGRFLLGLFAFLSTHMLSGAPALLLCLLRAVLSRCQASQETLADDLPLSLENCFPAMS